MTGFWFGVFVGLAAWQFLQVVLDIVFLGKSMTISAATIATHTIFGLALLTIAFAGQAGVL